MIRLPRTAYLSACPPWYAALQDRMTEAISQAICVLGSETAEGLIASERAKGGAWVERVEQHVRKALARPAPPVDVEFIRALAAACRQTKPTRPAHQRPCGRQPWLFDGTKDNT